MPDDAMTPRRAAALPSASHLMRVCADRTRASTPLDFLAASYTELWRGRLREGDRPALDDTAPAEKLIAATTGVTDLTIGVDREVRWQLDARPVKVIEDGGITLGELVARVTLYYRAFTLWPDIDLMARLRVEAARYDLLVHTIVALDNPQPWRRSHGEPDLDLAARIEALSALLYPGETAHAPLLTTCDGTTGATLPITDKRAKPTESDVLPMDLETDVPVHARVLDYLCGGKDNYTADRELVKKLDRAVPELRAALRSGRTFIARAVAAVLAEHRIDRVVSVGMRFLNGHGNHATIDRTRRHDLDLHVLVRSVRSGARTTYLDSSPLLVSHARAMSEGDDVEIAVAAPTNAAAVSTAIRSFAGATPVLVCVEMLVLERISDPHRYLRTVLEAMAPGSYLLFTHLSADTDTTAAIERTCTDGGLHLRVRARDEIADLLDGTEPLPPGLIHPHQWHPDEDPWAQREHARGWAPAQSDPSLLYAAVTATE